MNAQHAPRRAQQPIRKATNDTERMLAIIGGGYAHRLTGNIETAKGHVIHLRADGVITTAEAKHVLANIGEPASLLWKNAPEAAVDCGEIVMKRFGKIIPLRTAARIHVTLKRARIFGAQNVHARTI